MKIISGILLLATTFLGIRHGWSGLHLNEHPEQLAMFNRLGIPQSLAVPLSVLNIALGIAVLFPSTFFISNLLHAVLLLLIMAFSLRAGDVRTALIEIPFLLIPLVLIYLGHPLIWRKSP